MQHFFVIALIQIRSRKISNCLLTPEFPLLLVIICCLLKRIIFIYGRVEGKQNFQAGIRGFKSKVKLKLETEKYVCIKNNNLDIFTKKWEIEILEANLSVSVCAVVSECELVVLLCLVT